VVTAEGGGQVGGVERAADGEPGRQVGVGEEEGAVGDQVREAVLDQLQLPGQELVMMQLWDRGPQRQTDLVRLLGSDAATMTRTVRRLEQAGFVHRCPSTTDKRVTIVAPTAASLALRRQVEEVWAELERSVTDSLSADVQGEAIDSLTRIEAALIRATAHDA
jgi:DNA-binding MarR family transcriptional regulator